MTWPRGVAVSADGSVYVADTDNERVQKFAPDGTFIDIIEGPQLGKNGGFHVRAVAVNPSDGKIYAVAAYQQRVDRFAADGKYEMSWGTLEKEAEFLNQPKGIALDPNTGDVFVADFGNHAVKRFTATGTFLRKFGEPVGMVRNEHKLEFPQAITVDDEGYLWVLNTGIWYPDMLHWGSSMYVRRFKGDGPFVSGFTESELKANMGGIAVISGPTGLESIYVSNAAKNEIVHFNPWGKVLNRFGADILNTPGGVIHDPWDSSLVVIDIGNNQVARFDASGALVDSWGSWGDGPGQFKFIRASAAAMDRFGNIYVADGGNHRVQVFDWAGTYLGEVSGNVSDPSARFRWPTGVAVNGDTLYVVDTGYAQIDMFSISS